MSQTLPKFAPGEKAIPASAVEQIEALDAAMSAAYHQLKAASVAAEGAGKILHGDINTRSTTSRLLDSTSGFLETMYNSLATRYGDISTSVGKLPERA